MLVSTAAEVFLLNECGSALCDTVSPSGRATRPRVYRKEISVRRIHRSPAVASDGTAEHSQSARDSSLSGFKTASLMSPVAKRSIRRCTAAAQCERFLALQIKHIASSIRDRYSARDQEWTVIFNSNFDVGHGLAFSLWKKIGTTSDGTPVPS